MTVTADLVASLVQQQYDQLPAKRKPVVRDNGLHEWVPLSGIVAQGKDNKLKCISLATGMKCLPAAKLAQAQGNILHDWHAEVLAIRAFNRFVLDECKALADGTIAESEFVRFRTADEIAAPSDDSATSADADPDNWHGQPFTWREDVLLHMYCSEAPCGDASMELTMASQEDASPWTVPPTPSSSSLPGRAYFSALGIVRRKPSRGDAPATLSKSCSDKLSLRQCTSLLSSVTALLVSPAHAYVSTLVLPQAQYNAGGCSRAFSAEGRMESLGVRRLGEKDEEGKSLPSESNSSGNSSGGGSDSSISWPGGYSFRTFTVEATSKEFRFSKRHITSQAQNQKPPSTSSYPTSTSPKITSSNLAVAWTASPGSTAQTSTAVTGQLESTLSGVLQGRRQTDARGASFASRRRLWSLTVEVADLLNESSSSPSPSRASTDLALIRNCLRLAPDSGTQENNPSPVLTTTTTYGQVKDSILLRTRRQVKEHARQDALQGWVRNTGDESFTL
ncbi:adenosine deaminase/editase [Camillea tinctor]|nr:adenosine deaminase/editase [Camillea tinctor]